jgi:hypothetical protein
MEAAGRNAPFLRERSPLMRKKALFAALAVAVTAAWAGQAAAVVTRVSLVEEFGFFT